MKPDKEFRSDGCSLWPDGRYGGCCVAHDNAYWKGGTALDRMDADLALVRCVHAAGYPVIAVLMLLGVRLGGAPWWPLPWRWGFRRPWPENLRHSKGTR